MLGDIEGYWTEPPEPEPPPLRGYAPRLCPAGPIHYARRDPNAEGVLWRCVHCDLAWRTNGGKTVSCTRCDELLDELARVREKLAVACENVSERTWERDHAIANYHRLREELAALRGTAKP